MTDRPGDLTLPLPAAGLVPQRRPMRLVDRLVEYENGSGVVEAFVAPGGVLVSADGFLEDVAMIELMAQAYGAIKGYSESLEGKPVKEGMLVGVSGVKITGRAREGGLLRVLVKHVANFDKFTVAEGRVISGDDTLASGTIKLWIP